MTAVERPIPFLSTLKRFSVSEYEHLIDGGFLDSSDRLELLDGFLVETMPQDPLHAGIVDLLQSLIAGLLPDGWTARGQLPLNLGDDSQPEPDLAVVPGPKTRYLRKHPTAAQTVLVVEVSKTTLQIDRTLKTELYARAGIPTYWIIDLVHETVEVYSKPKRGKTPRYMHCKVYARNESIPFAVGDLNTTIAAGQLLP
jgi:Uma2 family endonuclease